MSKLNHLFINSAEETKNGPLILFLHEALGSIPQWKNFPEELCKKLNLEGLVYERTGHGHSPRFKSSRTSSYLHEYALDELPEFLSELELKNRKLILVGHSDGGSIALLFAKQYFRNVLSVITMAAHVINEPETIEGVNKGVLAYKEGKLAGLKKYHFDKTEELFFAWADTWRSSEFKNWSIEKDISPLKMPSLILQGELDQYGTVEQINGIKKAAGQNCEIQLIPNCGHHPHLENKIEVINLISKWCNEKLFS